MKVNITILSSILERFPLIAKCVLNSHGIALSSKILESAYLNKDGFYALYLNCEGCTFCFFFDLKTGEINSIDRDEGKHSFKCTIPTEEQLKLFAKRMQ